jgi:hypothetical protein
MGRARNAARDILEKCVQTIRVVVKKLLWTQKGDRFVAFGSDRLYIFLKNPWFKRSRSLPQFHLTNSIPEIQRSVTDLNENDRKPHKCAEVEKRTCLRSVQSWQKSMRLQK